MPNITTKLTERASQRGFTIVELLIVIVVIAILAAITIVAYNGIQTRARDTSALAAAGSLAKKIEAFNSVTGAYPTYTAAGNITSQLSGQNESTLTGSGITIQPVAASITSTNGTSTLQVLQCAGTTPTTPAGATTGYQIYVYDYNLNNGTLKLAQSGGVTTACVTSTSGS